MVDVLTDNFAFTLKQSAQKLQVVNAAAHTNQEAPSPVADAPAVVPLGATADQFQDAQEERAARPPIVERPRREVCQPDRLADRYTPSLCKKKHKKKWLM